MTEQHIKEQLSRAYVRAIAARAGIILHEYTGDDYGVDGRFADIDYDDEYNRYSENGFGIDFQIKATSNIIPRGDALLYDLEVKNYRDLIRATVGYPRILILYVMPRSCDEWLTSTHENTILKLSAWWCSLKGGNGTPNKEKIRIRIPVRQRLDTTELQRLIARLKGGEEL